MDYDTYSNQYRQPRPAYRDVKPPKPQNNDPIPPEVWNVKPHGNPGNDFRRSERQKIESDQKKLSDAIMLWHYEEIESRIERIFEASRRRDIDVYESLKNYQTELQNNIKSLRK